MKVKDLTRDHMEKKSVDPARLVRDYEARNPVVVNIMIFTLYCFNIRFEVSRSSLKSFLKWCPSVWNLSITQNLGFHKNKRKITILSISVLTILIEFCVRTRTFCHHLSKNVGWSVIGGGGGESKNRPESCYLIIRLC